MVFSGITVRIQEKMHKSTKDPSFRAERRIFLGVYGYPLSSIAPRASDTRQRAESGSASPRA